MSKLLLVEDNEMNLDMLSRRLKRRGFEVITATDGAEGVECAQAHLPDLILMDMSLPVMDGYEATRVLKDSSRTRHIPILGLSAHAMSGDADKALQAGCDDYDTKPVELRRLIDKIKILLQGPPTEPFPVVPKPPPERSFQGALPAPPPGAPKPHRATLATVDPKPWPRSPAETVPLPRTAETAVQGHALLVMRDAPPRRRLGQQLQELGYTFESANPAEGEAGVLRSVAHRTFHALFLDHHSPGLNAEHLVQTLRLDAGSRDLPILLVGTVDGLESAFQLIKLGANFFLPLPVSNHLLETRLKSARSSHP